MKCSPIYSEINNKNINECEHCGKIYSRIDSLTRHHNVCKIKLQKEHNEKMENLLKKLIKQQEAHSKKLEKITKENNKDKLKNNGIINNGSVENIFNNCKNINFINVLPFPNDDKSFLTEKDKKNLLNKRQVVIQEYLKKIKFDPNNPQNHNVYISNIKSKYGIINNGKEWIAMQVSDILDILITHTKDEIESLLEEFEDVLPEKIINKIKGILESVEYDPTDSNEYIDKIKLKLKEKIMDEVKLILYNNKHIIKDTENKTKNKK
jgi:hypothetical protein